MKKGTKNLIAALAVIFVIVFAVYRFWAGNYNAMVSLEENVNSQWAQVENQYQRRLDLIPNLVATVKGYAAHENAVFTDVAQARAQAGGVMKISDDILNNQEAFSRFQQAQGELSGALQRLLAVTENYPQLKADSHFLALQDQLEGTENRISVERKRFNDTAKTYNVFIRQFPRSVIARSGGFTQKAYFQSAEGAQTAPAVSF
ncbi:MAG: LemA family protein [Bacteroides sp.]|nr:LemA family protein [Prevotella sp.]MCM1406957.1 LemA family protein [Treponema brennaborense]MCM1470108.1 LemA family protein [Bacteroides sp.]